MLYIEPLCPPKNVRTRFFHSSIILIFIELNRYINYVEVSIIALFPRSALPRWCKEPRFRGCPQLLPQELPRKSRYLVQMGYEIKWDGVLSDFSPLVWECFWDIISAISFITPLRVYALIECCIWSITIFIYITVSIGFHSILFYSEGDQDTQPQVPLPN